MPSSYRVRRTRKGAIVVRGPGGLAAVGSSAFPRVRTRYLSQNPHQVRVNEVEAKGRKPFEDAKKLDPSKRIPSDADPSTVKHVFTQMRMKKPGRGRAIVEIDMAPGKWSDNFYARNLLNAVEQSHVRGQLREENRSRGKRGYASEYPQLVGASALLSIGKQWLVIPNRGHTRLYDGFYHVIGGTVETKRENYPKQPTRGFEQAREELEEETGLPRRQLQFLQRGMKATPRKGTPKPLAVARSMEKVDPSADLVYSVNVATKNPGRFLLEHFKEKKPGQFELKTKPKEDEAAHFAIIPMTKEGVRAFIARNNERITPVLRIALEAMLPKLLTRRR